MASEFFKLRKMGKWRALAMSEMKRIAYDYWVLNNGHLQSNVQNVKEKNPLIRNLLQLDSLIAYNTIINKYSVSRNQIDSILVDVSKYIEEEPDFHDFCKEIEDKEFDTKEGFSDQKLFRAYIEKLALDNRKKG